MKSPFHPNLDERDQLVQQKSSWLALLSMFTIYLVISIYYGIRGEVVPWSTQILFYSSLLIFVISSMYQEGIQFQVPGLPESPETLEQPALVRSIPWLMVLTGITTVLFNGISFGLYSFHTGHSLATSLIPFVSTLVIFPFYYGLAYFVRRGLPQFISLAQFFFIIIFLSYCLSTLIPLFNSNTSTAPWPGYSGVLLFTIITTGWISYGLIRFNTSLLKVSNSFPEKNTKWEEIGLYFLFAIIVVLGLIAAPFYSNSFPISAIFAIALPTAIIWLFLSVIFSKKRWNILVALLSVCLVIVLGFSLWAHYTNPSYLCKNTSQTSLTGLYPDGMDGTSFYVDCQYRFDAEYANDWSVSTVKKDSTFLDNEVKRIQLGNSQDGYQIRVFHSSPTRSIQDWQTYLLKSTPSLTIADPLVINNETSLNHLHSSQQELYFIPNQDNLIVFQLTPSAYLQSFIVRSYNTF